jgi:GxxExxY protein
LRGLQASTQVPIEVKYKGQVAGIQRLDLWVAGLVIVELKAVAALNEAHAAQLRSYLRATGCRVGLLLNFGEPHLRDGIRRMVWTHS